MHTIWNDLVVPGVPVAEKIIRPIVVYLFLLVAMRLAGKRELAQLTPFDLVIALTLSNAVQNAIIGNDNSLTGGLIGATTLLVINYLVVRMLYQHRRADQIFEGQPRLLIDRGRLLRQNMARELITEPELIEACHRQGVERIEDVEKAILETSGTISVFTRHPTRDELFDEALADRLETIERLLRERGTEGAAPEPA